VRILAGRGVPAIPIGDKEAGPQVQGRVRSDEQAVRRLPLSIRYKVHCRSEEDKVGHPHAEVNG
jgi:hypothetical protein